jgi:hypothetical protein
MMGWSHNGVNKKSASIVRASPYGAWRYPSWSKEGTGNCSIGEIMMVIPAPTHPCHCLSSLVALHVVGSRREIIAFQYCEDQMDVIHNRSVMVLKSKMHTIRLKQLFSTWGGAWLFQWQSKSTRRSRKLMIPTGRRAVVLAYIILSIAAAKTSGEGFDICFIPLLIGSVIIVFLREVSCDAVSIYFRSIVCFDSQQLKSGATVHGVWNTKGHIMLLLISIERWRHWSTSHRPWLCSFE